MDRVVGPDAEAFAEPDALLLAVALALKPAEAVEAAVALDVCETSAAVTEGEMAAAGLREEELDVVIECTLSCDFTEERDIESLLAALRDATDEARCVDVADTAASRVVDAVGDVDATPDLDGCDDWDSVPLPLREDTDESDAFALRDADTDCECEIVGLDAADSDPLVFEVAVADDDRDARCDTLTDGEDVDSVDALSVFLAETVGACDIDVE